MTETNSVEIGQLPSHLSEKQLQKLSNRTKNFSTDTHYRLARDPLLKYIDSDSYKYTADNADRVFTDRQHKCLLHDINSMYHSHALRLMAAAEQIIHTSTNSNIIFDLVSPERIPNEYSIDSRNRICNIMSTLYRMKGQYWQYEQLLHLQRLNTKSKSNSRVYAAKYMGKYPMLIKVMQDYLTTADLVYEYLVGTVVNRLRRDIPNFMYTYGITRDIDVEEVVQNGAAFFCREEYYHYTLAVEYLENGIRLYDMTADTTIKVNSGGTDHVYTGTEMVRILLLQILCAMIYAYHTVGFIHRDPHSGNIMLVPLGRIMAVPIMIPVSYTWQNGRADVQFEQRYILTDTLVMFIDYGLSTVDAVHLNSTKYRYEYLISMHSVYHMYESRSAFENDIVIMLVSLFCCLNSTYIDTEEICLSEVASDVISIMYRLYTGQTLDSTSDSIGTFWKYYNLVHKKKFNYYVTHPSIKYDPYGAIIEYCTKYADKYTVLEYSDSYQNVLDRTADLDYTCTIRDTMQYSWYTVYSDELVDYKVDMLSVLDNEWYRSTVLNRIMKGDYSYTNKGIIQSIYEYTGDVEQSALLVLLVYRYMSRLRDLPLDMLPFKYDKHSDIAKDLMQLFLDEPDKYWNPMSTLMMEYITKQLDNPVL